jgi:hypothetical protein
LADGLTVAPLYADENVPRPLVDALQAIGHDVLTALADGRANQRIPDPDVLRRATALGRAVLTNNRGDYVKLHRSAPTHAGIIIFTDDKSQRPAIAVRIDAALTAVPVLAGQLLRVNLPARPPPQVP